MAPKNAPPAAKQAKILQWFQSTMGVYTLKDLEKLLPSIASINGMQVKEYLQALHDEGAIKCEKIGSGNWYWCFVSDARKQREGVLGGERKEEGRLREGCRECERGVREEEERQRGEGSEVGRGVLVEVMEGLRGEMERLDRELRGFCEGDPREVQGKIESAEKMKVSALLWTDNLEVMASYLVGLAGRDAVAELMVQFCGEEYVAGEGLKELLGP